VPSVVFFQPTATGLQTGTLTITDNVAGSPQTVQLSGTELPSPLQHRAAQSTSVTIQQGGTATYNLTVKAEGGYVGSLAVSCTGAPSGMQCTPSPSSLALTADAPTATVVFKVSSASSTAKTVFPRSLLDGVVSLALFFGIFGPSFRRKGYQLSCFMSIIALCALFITMTACGGGSHKSPGGGSTQTEYTLQAAFITATGDKVQVPLKLTVVKQSNP